MKLILAVGNIERMAGDHQCLEIVRDSSNQTRVSDWQKSAEKTRRSTREGAAHAL